MAFVRINGVLLHYRLSGHSDRPTLALVNSLGTDARIWDAVIANLGDRYCILSYDKRGHGLSDVPTGDYSIDDHVADLLGLLEHLNVNRLALAGVSVGGMIAQAFAARYGTRLQALVLCDTAARIGSDALWNERIAAVRAGGMAAIVDAVMERWFTPAFRRDQPDDVAGWRALLERTPVDGYAGTCAALRDADLRDTVGQIVVPTLVVVGDQDQATPVELVRETAERIPGARFSVIGDSGHIPAIDQPATLAGMMQQFLSEAGHG